MWTSLNFGKFLPAQARQNVFFTPFTHTPVPGHYSAALCHYVLDLSFLEFHLDDTVWYTLLLWPAACGALSHLLTSEQSVWFEPFSFTQRRSFRPLLRLPRRRCCPKSRNSSATGKTPSNEPKNSFQRTTKPLCAPLSFLILDICFFFFFSESV